MIPESWKDIIPNEIPSYPVENSTPSKDKLFRAFELVKPEEVKFVILGQDPYPTEGHATGLAFSVPSTLKVLPPSLKNMFRNMVNKGHIPEIPKSGCLERWAMNKGILLMNCALTTEIGKSNAHEHIWKDFTDKILSNFLKKYDPTLILLGKFAIKKCSWYEGKKICSSHPSPLGASSKCMDYPSFNETDVFGVIFKKNNINEQLD